MEKKYLAIKIIILNRMRYYECNIGEFKKEGSFLFLGAFFKQPDH
jgi:hypothetical protein